ncbi:hypothetical protein AOLI_G00170640 [Acnodon oligacanthus]
MLCPDNGHLRGLIPPWNPLFPLLKSWPLSVGSCKLPSERPSERGLILEVAPLASYTCLQPCGNEWHVGDMAHRLRATQGFHPESNGQTEQVNQDLAWTLRSLTSTNPASWAENLPWAKYAHKSLWHSSLSMSPFKWQFWFPPPMFPEEEREVRVPAAKQFVQRCRRAWQKDHASLLISTKARKQVADRRRYPAPTFMPGQRVWLSARDLQLQVESKKLAPKYVGPFKIDRRVDPVSYQLCLPPSMRIHPAFHISLLRPFLCGTWLPAPHLVAGSPAYTVCYLLDSRCVQSGVQYLVDWKA